MLSQIETEFAEFDAKNCWIEVYQRLKNEASLVSLGDNFSTKFARDPDNRRKNRYRDVSPYDHSRVQLSGENDYINASFIEVPDANRKYILTQGPLEHTMDDFWQMVWEQESKAIVMLNKVVEKGQLKCSQYWPLGADYGYDQKMYFPESCIQVTLTSEQNFVYFTVRTLELERRESGERREVLHFHYTTWPDFGVPSSPNAFLHFLHSVRETGSLEADIGPAIIHCSAGIGRSGTFCLADSCLVMVENSGTIKHINLRKTLIEMRTYRMGLIQTSDQLRFSYLAIIEGAQAILAEGGLGNLQLSPLAQKMNKHTGDHSPPRPVKATIQPTSVEYQNVLDILSVTAEDPPSLPPKKKHVPGHSDMNGWGEEEEDSETEDDQFIHDDDDEENFDHLIHAVEDDNSGSGSESFDEIREAEKKHQIRLERKKQTVKKIQQMKERQKKSERCQSKTRDRRNMYIGLAVIVGVAAVVIYKYLA